MYKVIRTVLLFLIFMALSGIAGGCGQGSSGQAESQTLADTVRKELAEDVVDILPEMVPLAESPSVFSIPMPTASGALVKKNEKAVIDYSNTKNGYVSVKYLKETGKDLRVIVKGPGGTSNVYTLTSNGDYAVYPLSDGNGRYQITVYENISGSSYSTENTIAVDVLLDDEFAPFLRPNQYVNYTKDSETVKKAAELVKNKKTLMEQISSIYEYTISNITYDKQLAANVQSGYVPDVDAVLKNGKGICLDYAAVMTAMLRSQGIPAKLVAGFAGEFYHAWISAYSKETGWINNVIYFDGENWNLMDPTFASNGAGNDDIMKYIGDGKNYTAKYHY